MVYADFTLAAVEVVSGLRAAGVLAHPVGPHTVRFVCHLDVGEADVARALGAVARLVARPG